MGRSIRKTYPVKVNYIIRLNAGKLQKSTGLPASFIHRLRAGKVKNISQNSIDKLSKVYNDYWTKREIKRGARPDEARSWVKADRPPDYFIEQENALLDAARKIQEARIQRDRTEDGALHPSWHPLNGPDGILAQMARDTTRTADDWTKYVKKVITGTPGGPRPVRYTAARIEQWKKEKEKYKRRRQEARREADKKGK